MVFITEISMNSGAQHLTLGVQSTNSTSRRTSRLPKSMNALMPRAVAVVNFNTRLTKFISAVTARHTALPKIITAIDTRHTAVAKFASAVMKFALAVMKFITAVWKSVTARMKNHTAVG